MPPSLTAKQISDMRAKVCAVAERQFVELGLERVSMRSLAAELGCSATALYRYFKNKDDLLAMTRALALDRLSDRLEAARATSDEPWERSRRAGAAYVDFAFEDPHAYRLIFALSQPDDREYPELARAHARLTRNRGEDIRRLADEDALQGDPELIGQVFWAGVHGLIVLQMAGKLGDDRASFTAIRRAMNRLIMRGAASPASVRRPAKA
jgi:AcrR family transcriptional regulator